MKKLLRQMEPSTKMTARIKATMAARISIPTARRKLGNGKRHHLMLCRMTL